MFSKSKYEIKFSKPQKEVMTYFDSNLYKKIFDSNKRFSGKVSAESFDIRFYNDKNSPVFKGKFTKNSEQKDYLNLTIGLGIAKIILSLFVLIVCPIYFFYTGDYNVAWFCLGVGILIQIINYLSLKSSKKEFLNYLKDFDKNCEITNIQKG